jgi:hypothetical protein
MGAAVRRFLRWTPDLRVVSLRSLVLVRGTPSPRWRNAECGNFLPPIALRSVRATSYGKIDVKQVQHER